MVTPSTDKTSRNMYNEAKRYVMTKLVQDVPWIDADENDRSFEMFDFCRRFIQKYAGDFCIDDAFNIEVATSPANTFNVKGGGGTSETLSRGWVGGNPVSLLVDNVFGNGSGLEGDNSTDINSLVSSLTYSAGTNRTTIVDSSAKFGYGMTYSMVGKTIRILETATEYTIISHTDTSIVVAGDIQTDDGVDVYNHYRINPDTPVGARTDKVFLDVYLDEVSSDIDSDLLHPSATTGFEAQRRWVIRQVVRVVENKSSFPVSYLDGNGIYHYIFPLATLSRTATANITAAMIKDERVWKPSGGLGIDITRDEIRELRPIPSSPADNKIRVYPGIATNADRGTFAELSVLTDTATFDAVSSGWRYDCVVLNTDGTLDIVKGDENTGSPVGEPLDYAPVVPDRFIIAIVFVDETGTVVVDESDITDVREFFNTIPLQDMNFKVVPAKVSTTGSDGVYVMPGYGKTIEMTPDAISLTRGAVAVISLTDRVYTKDKSITFDVVSGSGKHRYDMVVVVGGTTEIIVVKGREISSDNYKESMPYLWWGSTVESIIGIPVALVHISETSTIIIDSSDIIDIRPWVSSILNGSMGFLPVLQYPPTPSVANGRTKTLSFIPGYFLPLNRSQFSFVGAIETLNNVTTLNYYRCDYVYIDSSGSISIDEGSDLSSDPVASLSSYLPTNIAPDTYPLAMVVMHNISGVSFIETVVDLRDWVAPHRNGALTEDTSVYAKSLVSNLDGATPLYVGQTVISLSVSPFNLIASYITGSQSLFVYRNGVKLILNIDYSETSSSSLTLSTPLLYGECIEIVKG